MTANTTRTSRGLFCLILAAAVALAGCSRRPLLTVVNQSSVTLSNVVVSGSGFSRATDPIPPGGEVRLRVRPRGESGLRLVFDAGSRHVDFGPEGYFEANGGYRVVATVGTNLDVTVRDKLSLY